MTMTKMFSKSYELPGASFTVEDALSSTRMKVKVQ